MLLQTPLKLLLFLLLLRICLVSAAGRKIEQPESTILNRDPLRFASSDANGNGISQPSDIYVVNGQPNISFRGVEVGEDNADQLKKTFKSKRPFCSRLGGCLRNGRRNPLTFARRPASSRLFNTMVRLTSGVGGGNPNPAPRHNPPIYRRSARSFRLMQSRKFPAFSSKKMFLLIRMAPFIRARHRALAQSWVVLPTHFHAK